MSFSFPSSVPPEFSDFGPSLGSTVATGASNAAQDAPSWWPTEWKWWHTALLVGGGVLAISAVGFVASGGKTSEELRREHHKRSQRPAHRGGPRGAPEAEMEMAPPTSSSSQHGAARQPGELQLLLQQAGKAKSEQRSREAILLYNKALKLVQKDTQNPSHLFIGIIEQSLAQCYTQLEKYGIAKKKLLRTIEILKKEDLDEDAMYDIYTRLVETCVRLGELTEAEDYLLPALRHFENSPSVGSNHLYTGVAKETLYRLRREQHRYKEAEQAIRDAVRIFTSNIGSVDALTIDARTKLGEILILRGRKELAVKVFDDLIADQSGTRSSQLIGFLYQIVGATFLEYGCIHEAERYFMEFKDKFDSSSAVSNREQVDWFLTSVYWQQGRDEEAEQLYTSLRETPGRFGYPQSISHYFISKPDTRIRIIATKDSPTIKFQFYVELRALHFARHARTQDTEDDSSSSSISVDLLSIDDVDGNDDATPLTSSSSSTPASTLLPSEFLLIANFESPDGEDLPSAQLMVTPDTNLDCMVLESAHFSSLKKKVYQVVIEMYSADRANKIGEHRQLLLSSIDTDSIQPLELARYRELVLEDMRYELEDQNVLESL